MATLTPETVKKTIVGWNVLFGGQRSNAELAVICGKFMKAFEPVYSDAEFAVAADMVEKETRFFPTIKEMMDCRESVRQVVEAKPGNYSLLALTDETNNLTDAEIEQNQRKIEIIKKMLCGELTMDQAEAEQIKLTKFAI